MKKTSSSTSIIILFAVIMAAACTKQASLPETASEKIYPVTINWEKTSNGAEGTFTLPANTKNVYFLYGNEQIQLIDKHPIKYMSCYWLYLLYDTKGKISFTPVSGEILPIQTNEIKILIRK